MGANVLNVAVTSTSTKIYVYNLPYNKIIGNGIGDVGEVDSDGDGVMDGVDTDGDGVIDGVDNAPLNKKISRTDFSKHMDVSLIPGSRYEPRWSVHRNVRERERRKITSNASIVYYWSSSPLPPHYPGWGIIIIV